MALFLQRTKTKEKQKNKYFLSEGRDGHGPVVEVLVGKCSWQCWWMSKLWALLVVYNVV